MDLVTLVMTVCLVGNPTKCRDENLQFESRGNLMQCMFLAPAEIAKWTGDHPALKVTRWKCAFPDKERTL